MFLRHATQTPTPYPPTQYGVATMIVVFLGIFGLPERLRETGPLGASAS